MEPSMTKWCSQATSSTSINALRRSSGADSNGEDTPNNWKWQHRLDLGPRSPNSATFADNGNDSPFLVCSTMAAPSTPRLMQVNSASDSDRYSDPTTFSSNQSARASDPVPGPSFQAHSSVFTQTRCRMMLDDMHLQEHDGPIDLYLPMHKRIELLLSKKNRAGIRRKTRQRSKLALGTSPRPLLPSSLGPD